MRLPSFRFVVATFLCLSRLPIALAHPRHHIPSSPTVPVHRTLKQHHVPRASPAADTCTDVTGPSLQLAAIYLNLDITADLLGILLGVDLCLCASLLPLQVDISLGVALETLVDVLGLGEVNALLSAVVDTAPSSACTHCTYPPHAKASPTCANGNASCGWECEAPYVKMGDKCVCPTPKTECNGVCALFPKGCSSATPCKREDSGFLKVQSGAILTLADAQATCREGEIVCGVYDGPPRGFECLNVNRTLDSCGGCVIPNPFLIETRSKPQDHGVSLTALASTGVDCTALPGVSRVACVDGQCVVDGCMAGWNGNGSGDGCVQALLEA